MSELTTPVSGRDRAQGSPDAPVTLLEYGDYECPDCGAAHPVVEKIQAHFGDDLRFVFRNFPLTDVHRHAEAAAEAAEAAAAQGRFWEMHNSLLEHQKALDGGHLAEYAKTAGLDSARYEREMREHAHRQRVEEDIQSGEQSGVKGTPTFFINGVRHSGAKDFEALAAAIQLQLQAVR